MRVRTLLLTTALLSSILGAVAVDFVLPIPNDVQADAMLKQARHSITKGDNAKGRDALTKIVQEYPRTNAAAAATAALAKIGEEERQNLDREIHILKQDSANQEAKLETLTQQLTTLINTPPKTVTVEVPAKKTSTKHRTTSRRHRRRR